MEKINAYILFAISWFCYITKNILDNSYSKKYVKYTVDNYVYNFFCGIISTVVLIIISGGIPKISLYTLLLGIVFGFATFFTATAKLQALKIGPMSYTYMITTISLIIPSISGRVFWNEKVTVFQYIGIIFMIICLVLSNEKGEDDDKKKVGLKWFAFCMTCFLLTGSIGVMQKFHQNSDYSQEIYGFLFVSFVVCSLLSILLFIYSEYIKKTSEGTIKRNTSPKALIILIVCGTCVCACNIFNLYLSGVMDSMFFFPVFNGGGLILIEIASLTLFHEKLSKKQWIGMASGIVAVAMLCIK